MAILKFKIDSINRTVFLFHFEINPLRDKFNKIGRR